MSDRAARLLHLLDRLRRARRPVSAAELAETLAVSPRTLYRDIASLRAQVPTSKAIPAWATGCGRASCCCR